MLTRLILERAYIEVLPQIPGRLKEDLERQMTGIGRGRLYLDPYYAVYVHDGRGPVSRGKERVPLIWYRDKNQDPRLDGGRTPNRAANLKHLTKAQFKRALANNQIIVKRDVKGTEPQPFFSNDADGGMYGFLDSIQPFLKNDARNQILATIGPDLLNMKLTTKFSIG